MALPQTSVEVINGDASSHLEELINGPLPFVDVQDDGAAAVEVELVGPHLRLAGTVRLGRFGRLSDLVNNHEGLIGLRNSTVWKCCGRTPPW